MDPPIIPGEYFPTYFAGHLPNAKKRKEKTQEKLACDKLFKCKYTKLFIFLNNTEQIFSTQD